MICDIAQISITGFIKGEKTIFRQSRDELINSFVDDPFHLALPLGRLNIGSFISARGSRSVSGDPVADEQKFRVIKPPRLIIINICIYGGCLSLVPAYYVR